MAVRVSLVQLDVSDAEPPAERVARVAELVHAERGRSDVVVLPELWHVGAFALDLAREHAEPRAAELTSAMRAAAATAGVWLHAGSFAELDGECRFNTSLLVDPDGEAVAWYRKQYLFGWEDGEPSVMTAGDDFVVVDGTPLGSVGLATCYDLRFPELFRGLVDRGATAFLLASGWPSRRIAHWSTLAVARAIENQAWLLACNTAGTHNGVAMGGRSVIVDPEGRVVAEAGDGPEVLRAEIDPAAATRWRAEFPVLADRRPELA